jgi:hypothetical protein
MLNLNDSLPVTDTYTQVAVKTAVQDGNIQAFSDRLEDRLCEKIRQYPVVVGCVAWLTNKQILKALATRDAVQVVVQQEDFLRFDGNPNFSKEWLRQLYDALPGPIGGSTCEYVKFGGYNVKWGGDLLDECNTITGWFASPIRIVRVPDKDWNPVAMPRMHNKFLVFCDVETLPYEQEIYDGHCAVKPCAVWTGSFNMTHNATRSMENALFVQSESIAGFYYSYWQRILMVSDEIEESDWKKRPNRADADMYGTDEMRIGT